MPEKRKSPKPADGPSVPGHLTDDPTVVWSYYPPKKEDCSCRVITNTTILTTLFRRVRPRGRLVRTPTSLTGPSSDAAWNTTVVVRKPAPCTFQVILPGRGAPPFVARSRANNGLIGGARFAQASSIVSITVRGTYHIQPKPGTAGTLRATYSGSIAGTQTVAGRLGSGAARVEVKYFVRPFDQAFRRVQNAGAGPGGRITGKFRLRGGTVGGPFVTNFGPIAATVPCCQRQAFTLVIDVAASRRRFVDSEARLDNASFTITAPDPPARAQVDVYSVEVNDVAEPDLSDPVPASGYRIRRLDWIPGADAAVSLTVIGERLVLVVPSDSGKGSQLVQVSLDSRRVLRRTTTNSSVGRLAVVPKGGKSHDLLLFGLAYSRVRRADPSAFGERGRVIQIDNHGRITRLGRTSGQPIDLAAFRDSSLLMADLSGNLFVLDPDGRDKLVLEGLDTPLALATPPPKSPWPGSAYVAEGREQAGGDEPPFGRIQELHFESCRSKTILDQVDVVALAFAPGGAFGKDLLIATANEVDSCGAEIQNTGQILRLSPDGTVEAVVVGIDSPSAIAFDSARRCLVLGSAGVFEVTRRR